MLRGQGSAGPCAVSQLSSRRLAQSLSHARGKRLGELDPAGTRDRASVRGGAVGLLGTEGWDGPVPSPCSRSGVSSSLCKRDSLQLGTDGCARLPWDLCELFKPPWMSLHFLSGNALSGCALVFSTSQQSTAGCRLSQSFWSQLSPQGLTK